MRHDSFICVTWLTHVWHTLHTRCNKLQLTLHYRRMRHDAFTYAAVWLTHMCDMTHLHVRHDSFTCETWLIHMCDTTNLFDVKHDSVMWNMAHLWWYMSYDSFTRETWLIHMWDMTHSHWWHDSSTCETLLIHTWDITHIYVRHDSFTCETWLIHMWDMTVTNAHLRHESTQVSRSISVFHLFSQRCIYIIVPK